MHGTCWQAFDISFGEDGFFVISALAALAVSACSTLTMWSTPLPADWPFADLQVLRGFDSALDFGSHLLLPTGLLYFVKRPELYLATLVQRRNSSPKLFYAVFVTGWGCVIVGECAARVERVTSRSRRCGC